MAIVNRDLDVSQQRDIITESFATVTGGTYGVAVVPYPAQLLAAQTQSNGLSGAPNHSLWIQRFVAGSGITSINIGASMVITTFGTSGSQGYTFNGANTTYLLQTGDLVMLSTAAANTATLNTTVSVVLKCLQDIKSTFGV